MQLNSDLVNGKKDLNLELSMPFRILNIKAPKIILKKVL